MLSKEEIHRIDVLCNENQEFKTLYQKLLEEQQYEVSKISHEIRNPVTLVNSFLQLLEGRYPDLKEDTYWMKILENMRFLRMLLDEVSDYNNSFRLAKKETNLYVLLSDIVDSFRSAKEDHPVSITLKKETPIPSIPVDVIKMKQAITNLLRNAYEAIDTEGSILLTIGTDGSDITICISDTGCGIPSEYLTDIFQPFATHKKHGTGLGLVITKRIVEAHEGIISVVTQEGKGATFTIVLPIC